MDDGTNREKALSTALANIDKQFGKGAIMRLGSVPIQRVPTIPTGSLALDAALGVGGIPRGRVIEIYGPESSGKTTLTLHAIAETQKAGGTAAFIDAEHALDPVYAAALGVNVDDLLLAQPDNGEQALEIAETLVRSGAVDLVVVDSVAALTPKAEIEGDMGDSHVGLQARLMSQALRKITHHVAQSKTSVIFINQIRMKIGVMFGNPETTSGGNALKFYASIRIDIRRGQKIERNGEQIGHESKIKVVKNKLAPPFRTAFTKMIYGEGISLAGELVELGVEHGLVSKSGAWYSINGERIAQGQENCRQYIKSHPDLADDLFRQLRAQLLPELAVADDSSTPEPQAESAVEPESEAA